VGETFVSVSNTAPALRVVINDYLERSNLDIRPDHEVDNLAMAKSLRGAGLLVNDEMADAGLTIVNRVFAATYWDGDHPKEMAELFVQ